jgi:serine/threonine-protein kinase ULK/ATG1
MASVRLFGVPSGMSLRGAAALVRSRSSRRAALIRSGEYPDVAEVSRQLLGVVAM